MGPFLVGRLLMVLIVLELLPGLSPQKTPIRIGKLCTCNSDIVKILPNDSLPDDSFHIGTSHATSCCKNLLLGYNDSGASVQWSFEGEDYSEDWLSTFRTSTHCGNETIMTTSGKITDRGEYSCTITATNGTSKTFTMNMIAEHQSKHRDVPSDIKSSPSVAERMLEDNVIFTCEAYVGTNNTKKDNVNLWWIKYFPNHTIHTFAKKLPNVNVTQVSGSGRSWGMIKSQLVISSIREIHFGIYQCQVTNSYGGLSVNMTLIEGIPETLARLLRRKTETVVVASLLGVVLVVLLGCYRWHRLLRLYCSKGTPSEEHQYDVFLVHGESATRWVWSILLPALEDFGYKCFLPQRNMCGGSMVVESILEALQKCHRVVVVMTPCLLDSAWATWATYSAIHTALTSNARILALVHKKQRFMHESQHKNPLLNVLKLVRKIKIPHELSWDISETSSKLHLDTSTSKQETQVEKTELRLILPSNPSNSLPKSQRLSNMISSSTTASREDLECQKDKTTEVGPVGEDMGLQDPGSPSSVTPFILSSQDNPSVSHVIGRCLRMVFIGDPKDQFWQTLRLHIGPRSLSRPETTDK